MLYILFVRFNLTYEGIHQQIKMLNKVGDKTSPLVAIVKNAIKKKKRWILSRE